MSALCKEILCIAVCCDEKSEAAVEFMSRQYRDDTGQRDYPSLVQHYSIHKNDKEILKSTLGFDTVPFLTLVHPTGHVIATDSSWGKSPFADLIRDAAGA